MIVFMKQKQIHRQQIYGYERGNVAEKDRLGVWG